MWIRLICCSFTVWWTLTPLVRQALDSETIEVVDFDCQAIHRGVGYGNVGGTAVYRVSGTDHDKDERMDWSLILKIFYPPAHEARPSDWNYWRREVDVYQSGWLDGLPGGLVAPRCFGVVEHRDGACWVWMEEVKDHVGREWPVEHYGVVAEHLGRFNGAYLAGRPIPSWPWMSSGWLRAAVAHAAPAITQLPEAQAHPIARRACPEDVVEGILRLWEEREAFLDAIERLPQTICHFDAFRGNLFTKRAPGEAERMVAIDWAFVGRGAVGEEIRPLLSHGLRSGEVERSRGQELVATVFEGYLKGLRDVGWHGSPLQVRLGCGVRDAMGALVTFGQALPMFLDESMYAWAEQTLGRPIEEIADFAAERRRMPLLECVDEARTLLGLS